MLDKIIVKYLSDHKRLVVPDFGAFIRKETGETVFVEFLKKDDSVLIALLQDNYGVTENEARVIIDNYVIKIRNTVAQLGGYIIEGLGSLVIDRNGIFELEYDPSIKVTGGSPKGAEGMESGTDTLTAVPAKPSETKAAEGTITPPRPQAEPPKPAAEQQQVYGRPQSQAPTTPAGNVANPGTTTGRTAATTVATPSREGTTVKTLNDILAEKTAPKTYGDISPSAYGQQKKSSVTDADKITTVTGNYSPPREEKNPVVPRRREPGPAVPVSRSRKKKADIIMIAAIAAALIAIGTMVYGIFINSDPIGNIQPTTPTMEVPVDVPPPGGEEDIIIE